MIMVDISKGVIEMVLKESKDYVYYVVFSSKRMFDEAVAEIAFQLFNLGYDPKYLDDNDIEKIVVDLHNGEFELDSKGMTDLIRDDMQLYYNSEVDEKDEEIYAVGNYVKDFYYMCEYIIDKLRNLRKVNGMSYDDYED